ncbi:tetratricopeptide repeat-containing sensor histidine kinase [Olleya aquimaris]|uniref:Tetratricopeptide repeat protein n=1 Tax=Olleya aquimaris TaxID=639310 RepID=A0A327RE95_9FLAO|nr:tetratricopeptide repeat protein [Olleya aquimaris]RAJ15021.1 tetratricopeptide repeat protein [Olleya aquimaris]
MKPYNLPLNNTSKLVASLLIFLLSTSIFAQNSSDFSKTIDSLITINYNTYSGIEGAIRSEKYDTLKMRLLEQKSIDRNYIPGQVFANIMLGNQYRNKSLFEKSESLLNKALTLSRDYNLIDFEIVSLNMLGVIYRRQAIVKEALDYHQEALRLAESQPEINESYLKSIAVSHNSMGNIYLLLKEYDLALDQFNKSLNIEKQTNNKLGLAINYNNIGIIYEAEDSLNLALKNYKISLDYNNQINSKTGKVISNNSIGTIYLKQNKPDLALQTIIPTVALAEELQDQFYIAWAYINLGWAQNELNQLQNAKKNLEKGLKVAEDYNLQSMEIEAKLQLSKLFEKLGNTNQALQLYKEAITLDNEITGENNSQYVNTLRMRYESEKKNNQILELAKDKELLKISLENGKKTAISTLLGLLVIGIAVFAFYRQRRLKSEKQILTLEQDMLRNQMNPHFIFNSLNSIKLYIINNEKENAVYYLSKFSKLIRKILIASTEKEITLKDELETMDLYINIENIRFSNQINYNITVEETVDIEHIKIPSLVLQPFLENALWHGLSAKEGDKFISLKVTKTQPNFITISITDNGIGRAASNKIKQEKLLKQKSLGIEITKQRLENFSKNYTENYSMIINDLYDGDLATGTCVILKLPIIPIVKLKTA